MVVPEDVVVADELSALARANRVEAAAVQPGDMILDVGARTAQTFARLIAPGLGAAPGAVVLRTDEIRKRLMGVPVETALSSAVYSPAFYAQVYEALIGEARELLAAGRSVVVDATFIQPELRGRVEALAREAGVPFHGVWLEADPEILAPRIEGREGDASDATVATLRMQLDLDVGEVAWRKVDASGPAADSAEAWVASIRG